MDNLILQKILRENLKEAILVNFSQIASFRFPREIFLKRKLTLHANPKHTLENQDKFVLWKKYLT